MAALRICLAHLARGVRSQDELQVSLLRQISSTKFYPPYKTITGPFRNTVGRSISRSLTNSHYIHRQTSLQSRQPYLFFTSPSKFRFYCINLGESKKDPVETGNTAEKKEQKTKDKWYSGKNAWKVGVIALTASAILMIGNVLMVWGPPQLDSEGNEIVDEFTSLPWVEAYLRRALNEAKLFKKMIEEPTSVKLLPDPLKEPYYQPPYTLVMEMKDVLVHPDWTLQTGWRFKKRPGVDFLLQHAGPPLFEIVIYTQEQGMTAFPIISGLDPNGYISFRLFKDSTLYTNGLHVKKLDNLNRDLSRVIFVDCDPKATSHSRNTFHLRPWSGNDDDRTLFTLADFLRTVGTSQVGDVRTVLDYYNQHDEPLTLFKENQRKLQEQQMAVAAHQAQEKEKKNIAGAWAINPFGRRK